LPWKEYNILARAYLDVQQTRLAFEGRMRALRNRKEEGSDVYNLLLSHRNTLKEQERNLLKSARKLFQDHELWGWCKRVRGLGVVAAMTFLGYINPEIATSAGKIWKIAGFAPDAKLRKGRKAGFNPELKGRFWLIGRNVYLKRDDYYFPLYQAKREYYLTKRHDLRSPKRINAMSFRWLIKLLISHAWELIRKAEGLPINPHHNYIPPKPENPSEALLILERATKAIREYSPNKQKTQIGW